MDARKRIAVVGSTNVDRVMRLDRLPAPGETVTDGEFFQAFGGKGANQAVAAARACGDAAAATAVTFLTCLGNDLYAPALVKAFLADDIDTDSIVYDADRPTGTALILIDRGGENCIAVAPGANYALSPAHVDACEHILRDSDMVVLQMEIPVGTILRTLEVAERHGTPVLFNFAPARTREVPVSDRLTGLVVNEVEAQMLAGQAVAGVEDAGRAALALLEQGPRFVVVTLGDEGAVVAERGGGPPTVLPAFPVTPADTTAAGDVFCGALAVALVEGRPLAEAARFASAASAISVTRIGAQPSAPRRGEIDAFLRERGVG